MIISIQKNRQSLPYKILSSFIAFTFIFSLVLPPTTGFAQLIPQTILNLPAPGTMVPMTPGFTPPIIKGVTVHPENPFAFDFIVGTGDQRLQGETFRKEAKKMIKYFLATLTVPQEELWVNLSPYEENQIIPEGFGDTEMGRDLLAQDYILKQLTASLMYPEDELGQEFWNRVYAKAQERYGTTEIPMNTFNKVWIVPEKAVVFEHGNSAFVVESHLKVMLEEDYEASRYNKSDAESRAPREGSTGARDEAQRQDARSSILDTRGKSSIEHPESRIETGIIREVIVPEIEKEVNEGQTFANLRQVYNSVILATWYKKNLRESLLGQIYIDKNKTKGVDTQDKQINEKIYQQYLEAFKKGVYNYIREDYDPATQKTIPRKYFSGGVTTVEVDKIMDTIEAGKLSAEEREWVNGYIENQFSEEAENMNFNVELARVENETAAKIEEDVLAFESQQAQKEEALIAEYEKLLEKMEEFEALAVSSSPLEDDIRQLKDIIEQLEPLIKAKDRLKQHSKDLAGLLLVSISKAVRKVHVDINNLHSEILKLKGKVTEDHFKKHEDNLELTKKTYAEVLDLYYDYVQLVFKTSAWGVPIGIYKEILIPEIIQMSQPFRKEIPEDQGKGQYVDLFVQHVDGLLDLIYPILDYWTINIEKSQKAPSVSMTRDGKIGDQQLNPSDHPIIIAYSEGKIKLTENGQTYVNQELPPGKSVHRVMYAIVKKLHSHIDAETTRDTIVNLTQQAISASSPVTVNEDTIIPPDMLRKHVMDEFRRQQKVIGQMHPAAPEKVRGLLEGLLAHDKPYSFGSIQKELATLSVKNGVPTTSISTLRKVIEELFKGEPKSEPEVRKFAFDAFVDIVKFAVDNVQHTMMQRVASPPVTATLPYRDQSLSIKVSKEVARGKSGMVLTEITFVRSKSGGNLQTWIRRPIHEPPSDIAYAIVDLLESKGFDFVKHPDGYYILPEFVNELSIVGGKDASSPVKIEYLFLNNQELLGEYKFGLGQVYGDTIGMRKYMKVEAPQDELGDLIDLGVWVSLGNYSRALDAIQLHDEKITMAASEEAKKEAVYNFKTALRFIADTHKTALKKGKGVASSPLEAATTDEQEIQRVVEMVGHEYHLDELFQSSLGVYIRGQKSLDETANILILAKEKYPPSKYIFPNKVRAEIVLVSAWLAAKYGLSLLGELGVEAYLQDEILEEVKKFLKTDPAHLTDKQIESILREADRKFASSPVTVDGRTPAESFKSAGFKDDLVSVISGTLGLAFEIRRHFQDRRNLNRDESIIMNVVSTLQGNDNIREIKVAGEPAARFKRETGEYSVVIVQDNSAVENKSALAVGTMLGVYKGTALAGSVFFLNGPITTMAVTDGKGIAHYAYDGEQFVTRSDVAIDLGASTGKDSPSALGGLYEEWPQLFQTYYLEHGRGVPGSTEAALKTRYSGVLGEDGLVHGATGANLYEILVNNGFLTEIVSLEQAKILSLFAEGAGGSAFIMTGEGPRSLRDLPGELPAVQVYLGNKDAVGKLRAYFEARKGEYVPKELSSRLLPVLKKIEVVNPFHAVKLEDFLRLKVPAMEERPDLIGAVVAVAQAAQKVGAMYVDGVRATGAIDSGGAKQLAIDEQTDQLFINALRPWVGGYYSEDLGFVLDFNGDGTKLRVMIDALDGSTRVKGNGGSGTIVNFRKFLPDTPIEEQSGKEIVASMIIAHGITPKLILAIAGIGVYEFVLDEGIFYGSREIDLSRPKIQEKGLRVALGGERPAWPKGFPELVDQWTKQGAIPGYSGALVTDIFGAINHILDGGRAIFSYPANKLRVKSELQAIAYLFKVAGGTNLTYRHTDGKEAQGLTDLLDVMLTPEPDPAKQQKAPSAFGDAQTVQEMRSALATALDLVLSEDWGQPTDPQAGKTYRDNVERILAHPDFANEDSRILANMEAFYRNPHSVLANTGQLVVLPIDQALEHDAYRSHLSNPAGADKWWQPEFAYKLRMSGYAAPYGTIKMIAPKWAKHLPLIAKINNSVTSQAGSTKKDMQSAMTSNIAELAALGVRAIGFTIYAGSSRFDEQYEELKMVAAEAKRHGMAVVVWSYPRGGRPEAIPAEHETALDVTIAAVKLAARAGANIIKIKAPSIVFRSPEKKAWLEAQPWFQAGGFNLESQADRMRIVNLLTNGRVQIFSGGEAREGALAEIEQLLWGGAFGNIIGRNSFKPVFAKGKDFVLKVLALNKAKARGLENYASIEEFKAYAYGTILPQLEAEAPAELSNYGPEFDINNSPTGVTYADDVARMLAEEFAAENPQMNPTANPKLLRNVERIFRNGVLAGTGKLFIAPYNKNVFVSGVSAYTVPVGGTIIGRDAFRPVLANVEDALATFPETPIIVKITPTEYTGGKAADYGNPAILRYIERLAELGVAAVSYELKIEPGLGYNAQMTELRAIMNKAKEYGLPMVVQAYPTGEKQNALDRVTASGNIAFDAGAHIIIIRQPNGEIYDEKNVKKELTSEKYGVAYQTVVQQMGLVKWYGLSGGRSKGIVTVKEGEDMLRNVAATLIGGGNGINLDQIPQSPETVQRIVAMIKASTERIYANEDELLSAASSSPLLEQVAKRLGEHFHYFENNVITFLGEEYLEEAAQMAVERFQANPKLEEPTEVYTFTMKIVEDMQAQGKGRKDRIFKPKQQVASSPVKGVEVVEELQRFFDYQINRNSQGVGRIDPQTRRIVDFWISLTDDKYTQGYSRVVTDEGERKSYVYKINPDQDGFDIDALWGQIQYDLESTMTNNSLVSEKDFYRYLGKRWEKVVNRLRFLYGKKPIEIDNNGNIRPRGSNSGIASSPATSDKGPEQKGGIDLNPALLNLQIKRDGNGVPLPLPQQPIYDMKIDGFVPVIINITPVSNLPMLLGLADTPSEGPATGATYNQGLSPMDRKSTLKTRKLEQVSLVN